VTTKKYEIYVKNAANNVHFILIMVPLIISSYFIKRNQKLSAPEKWHVPECPAERSGESTAKRKSERKQEKDMSTKCDYIKKSKE
jgi:hypothetical protein